MLYCYLTVLCAQQSEEAEEGEDGVEMQVDPVTAIASGELAHASTIHSASPHPKVEEDEAGIKVGHAPIPALHGKYMHIWS